MRKAFGIAFAVASLLLVASAGYAERRPHEGRIVRVETVERSTDVGGENIANVQRSMIVQGERGDQWTLYWDDTTKFKNNLSPTQLREGDKVHFEFVNRDGKMWLTELRRTKRAERD